MACFDSFEYVSEVRRLLQLCKDVFGRSAKIDVIKQLYDLNTANVKYWSKNFETVTIAKARELQVDTQSYSFWLYLEDFLVKFAGDTKFVPVKNWWIKERPTKWCQILTAKGKACRNYSMAGRNKCVCHKNPKFQAR